MYNFEYEFICKMISQHFGIIIMVLKFYQNQNTRYGYLKCCGNIFISVRVIF